MCESHNKFEGFRPEWYISTLYHCRDIPFWWETLNIFSQHLVKGALLVVLCGLVFLTTGAHCLNCFVVRQPSQEGQTRFHSPAIPGQVIPVTHQLILCWLSHQAPCILGSVLGPVGPVSVYCDWVRCCLDVRRPRNKNNDDYKGGLVRMPASASSAGSIYCDHLSIYLSHNLVDRWSTT